MDRAQRRSRGGGECLTVPVSGARQSWLAAMPFVFVLLWSTGFIVAKYAAPHAPPLTFLLYRFAGAIAVLLPIILLTGAPWPRTARAWRDIVVVGVLLQATYLGGVWVAIALGMPARVSALLVGTQPLFTALLGGAVLGFLGRHCLVSKEARFPPVVQPDGNDQTQAAK